MIEVEKKFILTNLERERLLDGAEYLNERVFTDIYYDTTDFRLTSRAQWLRSRDGRFELKLPLHADPHPLVHDELEDEDTIKKVLGFEGDQEFGRHLEENGYSAFCTCTTARKKYKKCDFVIDLDITTFEGTDFVFAVGEIELMVSEESAVEEAIQRLMAFAREHQLAVVPVRGKVVEYLKQCKPQHYRALVAAGQRRLGR